MNPSAFFFSSASSLSTEVLTKKKEDVLGQGNKDADEGAECSYGTFLHKESKDLRLNRG